MLKEIDRLLSSRTFLKVISLLMAIAIWYYVASDRTSEVIRTFLFPIEYLNVPSEYAINSNVRKVEVQVSASRELFLGKRWSEITCQADLRGLGPGRHVVPVKVILPSGFKLISISPASIEINIIKTQSKEVPIKLKVSGGLPPGYTLEEVRIEPEKVVVKGPENDLRNISDVKAEVTFEMLKDRNSLVLPLKVSQETSGAGLIIEPSRAKVSYFLIKGVPKKTVPINIKVEGKLDRNYKMKDITIEPKNAVVEGPLEVIEDIKEIVLPVNVNGIKEDVTIKASMPEIYKGAKVLAPDRVTVNLMVEPNLVRRTFEQVFIVTKGKSIYPSWRVKPESASVTLEGVPSVLEEGAPVPVELYVEVTNLVSTEIRVPLQYKLLKPGVKVLKIEPPTVKVFANME